MDGRHHAQFVKWQLHSHGTQANLNVKKPANAVITDLHSGQKLG